MICSLDVTKLSSFGSGAADDRGLTMTYSRRRRWFSLFGMLTVCAIMLLFLHRPSPLEERCKQLRRGMTRNEAAALLGPSSSREDYYQGWESGGVVSKSLCSIDEYWEDQDVYINVLFDPDRVHGFWACRKSRSLLDVILPSSVLDWLGPRQTLDFSNTINEG